MALKTGARHGTPVALAVDAKTMYTAGIIFYCAPNGVWLVHAVPTQYITSQTQLFKSTDWLKENKDKEYV